MRLLFSSIESWNRRLHYQVGLVLLPFVGLFAFTGLLLNHSSWKFTEFWPGRHEDRFERAIRPPAVAGDLDRARDIAGQLNAPGEVEAIKTYPDPARFEFRVGRPGKLLEIKADLVRKVASVKRIQTNGWGIVLMLHRFSGVNTENPGQQRNWLLTSLWSLSMDVVAIGFAFMALSSIWMWYRLKTRRRLGVAVLAAGVITCGFFVVGLRLLT
jgi:hypothetical protein